MKQIKKGNKKHSLSPDWFIENEDSRYAYRLARNKNGPLSASKLEYTNTPDWLIDMDFEKMSGEDFTILDEDLNQSGWKLVTSSVMPKGDTLINLNYELRK